MSTTVRVELDLTHREAEKLRDRVVLTGNHLHVDEREAMIKLSAALDRALRTKP